MGGKTDQPMLALSNTVPNNWGIALTDLTEAVGSRCQPVIQPSVSLEVQTTQRADHEEPHCEDSGKSKEERAQLKRQAASSQPASQPSGAKRQPSLTWVKAK
jgi:hypothetical protein